MLSQKTMLIKPEIKQSYEIDEKFNEIWTEKQKWDKLFDRIIQEDLLTIQIDKDKMGKHNSI